MIKTKHLTLAIITILAIVGLVWVSLPKATIQASSDIISISPKSLKQDILAPKVPYYIGAGKYSLDSPVWSSSYTDSEGKAQPINSEITSNVMDKAGYSFRLLQTMFNAGQIAEFAVKGQTMRLQPMALQWTNDLDQITSIASPRSVTGIVSNVPIDAKAVDFGQQGSIKWTGAYGTNRDFEWITMPTRLAKVLTIKNASNLPTPTATIQNGGNPVLRFSFIITPSAGVSIYVDNVLWMQGTGTKIQTFEDVEFRNTTTNEILWRIPAMYYWDSKGNQGESIKTLRKVGSSLYIDIRVPYSWLQKATYPVYIDADVTIEGSAYTLSEYTNIRGGPFWTYGGTGYVIYLDTNQDLVYRKTTDGGTTWAAAVSILAGTIRNYDCWADWQTTGDTGTKINIALLDDDSGDLMYASIETEGDTVATDLIYSLAAGALSDSTGLAYHYCTITKTRGGNIAITSRFVDSSSNYYYLFYTSPDANTWTSKTAPWESATDYALLYPANLADDDDLWATFWDISANEVSLKTFDDSGNSWSENSIASSMTESSVALNMDGAVRQSDGHLIFTAWNEPDAATADLKCWDITDGGTITAKTNVLTDSAESMLCSVFIDQATDDIYVAYAVGGTWQSTVTIYYNTSGDGGTNWDGSTAMQADAADDHRWVSAGAARTAWRGKFQPVWFDDDDNDIFCNVTNGIVFSTDVLIDGGAYSTAYSISGRAGIFWKSTTVGYLVFVDGSQDLKYRKTSDGGATWDAAVNILTGTIKFFDCWADWQTAGDAGTKVHIAYIDHNQHEVRYVYLDVSTDTVAGDDQVEACGGTSSMYSGEGLAYYNISITKAVGGNIAIAVRYTDSTATTFTSFYTSPDTATWTQKTDCFEDATADIIQLYAGNEADTQDLWAAYWDVSADEISLKTFDNSGNSWGETSISGSMVESATYLQMDGQVRLSDSHLIFSAWNGYDAATADLKVWDINGSGSITAKTDAITNTSESFTVSVFVNQVNDDLYIAYLKGSAAGSDEICIYRKSTDDAGTWSSDLPMQMGSEDDMRWISAGCIKATLGGKFQPVWFDDDDNDLFCNTDNGVTITATGGTYDIANDPSSKAFGVVAASSTYYADGGAPNNPVQDGDCNFTITNDGDICDIDVHGHNFTGGVGWTLTSNAPGSNEIRITVYYSGQDPAAGIVITTSDQEFYDNLAASATIKWDLKLETGTFTDGTAKTGVITLTAVAPD